MILSAQEWAIQQWSEVKLGDARLNRRVLEMGAKMAAHPEASLPEQMGSPHTLKAAYGALNHPGVTLDKLTAPHRKQTLERAGQETVVLMIQDTTELDYSAHPSKRGLGPIGDGRGRGLLLHSTLALEPNTRDVLGLADVRVVLRQPKHPSGPHWRRSPEGRLWEDAALSVGRPPKGVLWVHVGDRGSDIFSYIATCVEQDKHFLVRAFRNRKLSWETDSAQAEQEEACRLLDYARSLPAHPDSAYVISLPAQKKRPARQAHLALQWACITLAPPAQAPPEVQRHQPLTIWVLRAWEPDPPADVEPVEWVLLSSLPIITLQQAQCMVDWYCCRWFCEDYHQCLKTGCRIEHSQLDDGADIQRLLGFAAPIATRLLQLRQAARQTPVKLATSIVEPLLVQVLACLQQQTDWQTMTVGQFWSYVSRLGGHQGRRSDGPPGWRTVWRGWRRISDLAQGARLFAELGV